jgi:hypothetical protein
MRRACNMKGRRGMHTGFWWERQKEKDQQENLSVGGG